MVGVIESIAAPVTDEVSIHILAKARFEPNDFTIAGARDGVASQRTVDTERRAPLIVPASPFESRWLVRINACWAEIDQITGKRALKGTVLIPAEIGVVGNLHRPKVPIPGKLLIEPPASPAMDATVHFMLDKGA
jgi:hypothetical protein